MNVIITGASSGIGLETAKIFAENGHNIIITARRKERLQALTEKIESKYNVKVLALAFDIRNKEEVARAVEKIYSEFDNIDILINNAGLAAGLSDFHESDTDDWDSMIDTNIKGLLYISKLISQRMVEKRKGHIINVGSIASYNVYQKGHVYCASKFAVRAITEGIREDLLKYGIKVSGIYPGMVETEFSLVRLKWNEKAAKDVYKGLKPLNGRDIAETILFMSNRPAHVNISDITVLPTAQANAFYTHREE